MSRFTNAEKVAELKRELGMRRHVYSKRVAEGKMRPADKDRLIAMTEEMLGEYEAKAATDSPDLFAPMTAALDGVIVDKQVELMAGALQKIIEIANDERQFQGVRLSRIIDIARGRER